MQLVSAIMPTRGRSEFARQAVASFLSQDYLEKQMVIMDDTDDASFPDGIDNPSIKYFRIKRESVPVKRNLACEFADGNIICHFDSDDLSGPDRISGQVDLLQNSALPVAGYANLFLIYRYKAYYWTSAHFVSGTSLCYQRSWWEMHHFNEGKPEASDTEFIDIAGYARKLARSWESDKVIARIHDYGHISPKNVEGYEPVSMDLIPSWFFEYATR